MPLLHQLSSVVNSQDLLYTHSLETRKYTDKDGNPRTAYEIKVDRAHFCESAGGRQNGNNNGNPPAAESVGGFTPVFPNTTEGFVESDDDLPF